MLHPHKDENGAGHADRQPGNVDDRVDFVPQDVADCYFEVVSYHGSRFRVQGSKFKAPGRASGTFYNLKSKGCASVHFGLYWYNEITLKYLKF
jgi:hypothetical protein